MGTSMKGFDAKFGDLPGYILGITREIWEERGVGPALKRYYADDVLVRAPSGLLRGNSSVAGAVLQTLHEFPDRQLVGEDVIWVGSAEAGFLSSHRLLSVMTHTGSGACGAAAGKPVRSRIIAECAVRDNQVREEWLVRDQAAIAHCLGMTARELAARQAGCDVRIHGQVKFFTPEDDVQGAYRNVIDDGEECAAYRAHWEALWNDKNLRAIRELYRENASVYAPGGATLAGHSSIDQFVVGYLAAFPDLKLQVDHLIVNRAPGVSGTPDAPDALRAAAPSGNLVRIAMRFSAVGAHRGWGRFGEPSGAAVHLLGLTQALMEDGRVTAEWIAIDEVAVWKQILAHAGLPAAAENAGGGGGKCLITQIGQRSAQAPPRSRAPPRSDHECPRNPEPRENPRAAAPRPESLRCSPEPSGNRPAIPRRRKGAHQAD